MLRKKYGVESGGGGGYWGMCWEVVVFNRVSFLGKRFFSIYWKVVSEFICGYEERVF